MTERSSHSSRRPLRSRSRAYGLGGEPGRRLVLVERPPARPDLDRLGQDRERHGRARARSTTDAAGRPCAIDLSAGAPRRRSRDRCPYVGDQAVTGVTLLVSTPSADARAPRHDPLVRLEPACRRCDPGEPLRGRRPRSSSTTTPYWVQDLYDYVLYTGDLGLARLVWPSLVAADRRAGTRPQIGRVGAARERGSGRSTTATSRGRARRSPTTTPATCSRSGRPRRSPAGSASVAAAAAWTARIAPRRGSVPGAHSGTRRPARTTTRPPGPPSIRRTGMPSPSSPGSLRAGGADRRSTTSPTTTRQPYGATIADNDVWDGYPWGFQASQRVYPFMAYFEVLGALRRRASTPRRSR